MKKPFEIARETLAQITARKLQPTPANYQSIYNEIAGIPLVQVFPEEALGRIAKELPVRNPGQEKQRGLLEFAISQRNWDGVRTALVAYGGFAAAAGAVGVAGGVAKGGQAGGDGALTPEFFQLIARLLEYVLPALGSDDARFTQKSEELLASLRSPDLDALRVKTLLSDFSMRLAYAAEEQAEIKLALLKLFSLVVGSVAGLGVEDAWLAGQVQLLQQAAQPPLSLRRLDEIEQQLKDLILKQTEASAKMQQSQQALREMLAVFISRLSGLSESSGNFQIRLGESQRQLEQAKGLDELGPVLQSLILATRNMAEETVSTRDELQSLREKSQAAEGELARMHRELDRIHLQVRHDSLTGSLNRRGLDEALEKEIALARKRRSALSVALLDIDNFKRLNDSKGHEAGDAALVHLAAVARECLRPQDVLARYGGEEFVILLPDTPLEEAVSLMTGVQRQLSSRLFLAGADKIMITFSAGVAQFQDGENGVDAVRRADQAMYLAKRAGRNRVLAS